MPLSHQGGMNGILPDPAALLPLLGVEQRSIAAFFGYVLWLHAAHIKYVCLQKKYVCGTKDRRKARSNGRPVRAPRSLAFLVWTGPFSSGTLEGRGGAFREDHGMHVHMHPFTQLMREKARRGMSSDSSSRNAGGVIFASIVRLQLQ